MKEAFGFRKTTPIRFLPLDNAIVRGIVENCLLKQVQDQGRIKMSIIHALIQAGLDFFKKHSPVHGHEIAPYVEFQDITVFPVIVRTRANEMVDPANAIMCPFSFSATVGVIDEGLLEEGRY